MEKQRSVVLQPCSFVDTSLADLSAEDAIRLYKDRETRRKRNNDDYGESDVAVSFRFVPEGLLESLDEISAVSGMHKAVVTKCLSHHVVAWYQSLPQIVVLTKYHREIQVRSDGFPDIVRKMQRDDYEFAHPRAVSGAGVLRTVAHVLGYLGGISSVLGMPVYKLFLTGLCWSVTSNSSSWAANTTVRFLEPEVASLRVFLSERLLALDYADRLARLRSGDPKMRAYVEGLGVE